jgi:hypothetical protein
MDHVSKETGRLLISIRTPQTRICVISFRSDGQQDVIVTLRQAAVPFPSIVENVDRAVYGWSATPLQWILQYWTPVEWTPVGVGVEWSEPSPTPVL